MKNIGRPVNRDTGTYCVRITIDFKNARFGCHRKKRFRRNDQGSHLKFQISGALTFLFLLLLHFFHQYTIQVQNGKRDELKEFLAGKNIPTSVFYPVPLYCQQAFAEYVSQDFHLPVTEKLCAEVLSLPIHTEMDKESQKYIIENVKDFFTN